MSRKNALTPYQIFTSASLGDNVESIPTNINWLDNVSIQLNFTGTPVGSFDIQVSLDYVPANGLGGAPASAGTWVSLPVDPIPIASGVADTIMLDLNELSFPWIKVVYTRESGTGTLNGYISAKAD